MNVIGLCDEMATTFTKGSKVTVYSRLAWPHVPTDSLQHEI